MGKNLKNNRHTYVCLCVCMYSGIWKIHVYKCTCVCVCMYQVYGRYMLINVHTCIYLNHCAIHLKLTQRSKPTILQ